MGRQSYSGCPSAHLYDALIAQGIGSDLSARGDVEFYLRLAKESGGPVLVLACGTGRITHPIARQEIEVVGLDLSTAMLSRASQKALAVSPTKRPVLVRGDMTRFSLHREFRLILLPFRSFQLLLTRTAQRRCLLAVKRHLAPDGIFIVNVFDPRFDLLETADGPRVALGSLSHPATGRNWTVHWTGRTVNRRRQTFRETWDWTELGAAGRVRRRIRCNLQMRWTWREEMESLLHLCGFQVLANHGGFQGGSPLRSAEQVWICRPTT